MRLESSVDRASWHGHPARPILALVLGAAVPGATLAAGCGARTALERSDAVASMAGGAGGSASHGGAGGAIPDAGQGGTAHDAGPPDASLPECRLQSAEVPSVVHSYGDRDLHTPSLVVVSPGQTDPGTGAPLAPPRVALQAVSSNGGSAAPDGIEVGLLELPVHGGVHAPSVVEPFFLLGNASLTYAQMVRAPGEGASQLALTWSGDSGNELGLVSTDPWGASSVSTILWSGGGTPLGFAAGRGVGEMGIGYGGLGYGLSWDEPGADSSFVAAVLDEHGAVVLGPHPLLGASLPSGAGAPSILWSGEAYLLATGVTECSPSDPLCPSRSVVVSRVRPASGDAWDDSGIDLAGAVGASDASAELGYASLAESAGSIAVAWTESVPSPTADPLWSLWMSHLTRLGAPIDEPVRVAQDTSTTGSLRLSGGSVGFVAVRTEEGDEALPDEVAGRSRIVLHQLDAELATLAGPIRIDVTRFGSVGFPAAVALEAPRGVLVTWSGRHPELNRAAVFAAFVPCAP
jgi:hypothetical protein